MGRSFRNSVCNRQNAIETPVKYIFMYYAFSATFTESQSTGKSIVC